MLHIDGWETLQFCQNWIKNREAIFIAPPRRDETNKIVSKGFRRYGASDIDADQLKYFTQECLQFSKGAKPSSQRLNLVHFQRTDRLLCYLGPDYSDAN